MSAESAVRTSQNDFVRTRLNVFALLLKRQFCIVGLRYLYRKLGGHESSQL